MAWGQWFSPSGAKLGPARSWEKRLASNSCQHGRCHTANHGQVRWPASRLPGSRPVQCHAVATKGWLPLVGCGLAMRNIRTFVGGTYDTATAGHDREKSIHQRARRRRTTTATLRVRGSPSRDVRGLRGESRLAGPGRIGPDVPVVLQALFQTRSTWTRIVGNHGPRPVFDQPAFHVIASAGKRCSGLSKKHFHGVPYRCVGATGDRPQPPGQGHVPIEG